MAGRQQRNKRSVRLKLQNLAGNIPALFRWGRSVQFDFQSRTSILHSQRDRRTGRGRAPLCPGCADGQCKLLRRRLDFAWRKLALPGHEYVPSEFLERGHDA